MSEPKGLPVHHERKPAMETKARFREELMRQGGVGFDLTEADIDQLAAQGRESVDPAMDSNVVVVLQPDMVRVGYDFEPAHGGKKLKNAQLRGEMDRPEVPTGRLVVAHATEGLFKDVNYAMDLSDAPPSLQAAIDQAWQTLQSDLKHFPANDIPPELQARKQMLEPIVALRIKDEPVVAEVKPGEDFPADSTVTYDPKRMNRLPATDQVIFAAYRRKGWKNLGKHQREHYRELKARIEATETQADAA